MLQNEEDKVFRIIYKKNFELTDLFVDKHIWANTKLI